MTPLLLCACIGIVIAGPVYLGNTTQYKAGKVGIEDKMISDVDGDEDAKVKRTTCSKDDVMIPINGTAKIGDTFWTCQQLSNGDVKAIQVASPGLSNKTADVYPEYKIEADNRKSVTSKEIKRPAPAPPNEEMEMARPAELGKVLQWSSDENDDDDDDDDVLDWPSEPLCVDHKGKTHPLGEVWDEDSFTAECMRDGTDSVRPQTIGCIVEGVKVPLNKERTIGADRWKCKLYSDGHILMQLKTGRSTRLRKRLGSCRDDSGNEYKVGEEWTEMNALVKCNIDVNGHPFKDAFACMKDGYKVLVNTVKFIDGELWKCIKEENGDVAIIPSNKESRSLIVSEGSELQ
ncbi:unnamed protein product [Heligmosomoides polygyrus]|uniref:Ricin B-type lectin domain-containing protein n=1 Tax=Heligmosomoides polygyrus TaxID=6339 RepID=A0A3P7TFL0_HELPZ|nr:unnamed protein product [Heligmosomoides polygyrus]